LIAAIRWYDERRIGLGAEFYDAVSRTVDRVAENLCHTLPFAPATGAAPPTKAAKPFSTWLLYVFRLEDGKWRIVHDQNTALDYAAFARSDGIEIKCERRTTACS
jgi:hypothetical protein